MIVPLSANTKSLEFISSSTADRLFLTLKTVPFLQEIRAFYPSLWIYTISFRGIFSVFADV